MFDGGRGNVFNVPGETNETRYERNETVSKSSFPRETREEISFWNLFSSTSLNYLFSSKALNYLVDERALDTVTFGSFFCFFLFFFFRRRGIRQKFRSAIVFEKLLRTFVVRESFDKYLGFFRRFMNL